MLDQEAVNQVYKNPVNKLLISLQGILLYVIGGVDVICMFTIVVFRYVLKQPIFGMEELVLYLAMFGYFLGCAFGSVTDSQIRADIIDEILKTPVRQKKFRVFTRVLEIIPAVFLTYQSIALCKLTIQLDLHSPVLRLPILLPQLVMALSFTLVIAYILMSIVRDIRDIKALQLTVGKEG